MILSMCSTSSMAGSHQVAHISTMTILPARAFMLTCWPVIEVKANSILSPTCSMSAWTIAVHKAGNKARIRIVRIFMASLGNRAEKSQLALAKSLSAFCAWAASAVPWY